MGSMSQLSQPIPIPAKDSPDEQHRQRSAGSSREGSPSSSSPGSKRKRQELEEHSDEPKEENSHPSKKRKTPPIESEPSRPDSETPRVGQIQKKVEEMKVNRISGGPYQTDPINGLSTSPPNDGADQEQQPDKDKDAADQPPTTPPKDDTAKPEGADAEQQEIETDSEETSAPVDVEMGVSRRRANGLKRIVHMDRPIEIDPQEYNRKRKASEKLAGSPFSSPAAKRAKEDDASRVKSPTITEEKSDPSLNVGPPSTPQAPASSGLKGFSAFASVASPFATVKSDNAPFGGGTRPSTIFGSSGAAPKFKSPFPTFSPFTTPKQPGTSSVFKSVLDNSDPAQDLAKETNTTPFPSTPVFGAPSTVGTSATPKAVFGRPSVFGVTASPSPSVAGPTRRAKSPRPSAFGVYASTASTAGRFAAPSGKIRAKNKAEEEGKESDEATSGEEKVEEPKQTRTFSELLASKGSDREESGDEKMVYTEQETITGEEEEINVFHGRGKLYHMIGAEWKERGPGVFKLNINKETRSDARIVMRRDGALNLLVNAKLFQGMKFAPGPDPRYVTFAILDEELKPKSHLLRFPNAKLAQDLMERAHLHIPK